MSEHKFSGLEFLKTLGEALQETLPETSRFRKVFYNALNIWYRKSLFYEKLTLSLTINKFL